MEFDILNIMESFYIDYFSVAYLKIMCNLCNNRFIKAKIVGKYNLSLDHYGRLI